MQAIVTGGTRGIGLGIASALLEDGWSVIVTARKSSDEMTKLAEKYGEKVLFVSCDNAVPEQRENLVNTALERFGSIDLLVNNAGVAPRIRKDMLEITPEDYRYCMDINLEGTFFLTQRLGKTMAAQGAGRIVNITSISSYTVSVNRAEYCISKAGLSMMTRLFAARLAGDGVAVFEVSPGIIETDMIASVKEQYAAKIVGGLTPVPRLGQPQDIAGCVLALASGKLDFCTGTTIHADGGFSVRRLYS
ncbi:MAG: 3-ketoacyl-ACP reductase [Oscillospiraceae bacterium]|nr:3-ketoacyl-ACP reductase [Oscillospiraceae bacterium]